MSIWTHVTGAIRFDGVPTSPHQNNIMRIHLVQLLGTQCRYDSPRWQWDACTVPCGSEGSLQYHIHEYDKGLPWAIVTIWGDLRDYEDVQAITDWFLKVCHGWPLVRQGIIEIQCGMERHVVQFNSDDIPKETA